jgi:hypothetical protein
MNKVIADLPPEEVAINDWLIYSFRACLEDGAFRVEAQVFLKATCSLEWCDSCVEVGLEEKWDASMICQERMFEDRDNPLTIH